MKYIGILGLILLTWVICAGQKDYFTDISLFDSSRITPKILYFHFKGCVPCKQMDEQVFSNQGFMADLSTEYDLYTVFEFEEPEKKIREKYNNKTNPEFIILSNYNEILHRFTGYHDKEAFLEQLNIAFSEDGLVRLDELYHNRKSDYSFLKKHFKAKENASQLDSSLIMEYLGAYPGHKFDENFIYDIAEYGYYRCQFYIPYKSSYFEILSETYEKRIYPKIQEALRVRLLFSLNEYTYKNKDISEKQDDILIALNQMGRLENGNPILLGSLYSDGFCSMITTKHPSIMIRYELTEPSDTTRKLEILEDLLSNISDNPRELNSIAWEIYTGQLDYPTETGIEIIETALKLNVDYHLLDTYAALLYKNNQFDEAKGQAETAIILAKETNEDYSETEKLLDKILEAIIKK